MNIFFKKFRSLGLFLAFCSLSNILAAQIEVGPAGSFWYKTSNSEATLTQESALEYLKTAYKMDAAHSFTQLAEFTDDLGLTHVKYQQRYKGIPVLGGQVILHLRDQTVESANGKAYKLDVEIPTSTISPEQAKIIASATLEGEQFSAVDHGFKFIPKTPQDVVYCQEFEVSSTAPFQNHTLFISVEDQSLTLDLTNVIHEDVEGTAQTRYSGEKTITADSQLGEFILNDNGRGIHTYNTKHGQDFNTAGEFTDDNNNWDEGTESLTEVVLTVNSDLWWNEAGLDANDLFYITITGTTNLEFSFLSDTLEANNGTVTFAFDFPLVDDEYEVRVMEYDNNGPDDLGDLFILNANNVEDDFSGVNTSLSNSTTNRNSVFLDAHWGLSTSYDYYAEKFDRLSYTGNSDPVDVYVHFGVDYNNAFWFNGLMAFGDGDGEIFGPLTSLDVCGHEMSHGVISGTADLIYRGESGALNESFADIFGTAIEFYGKTEGNWSIGEEFSIDRPFLRSMSDPNLRSHPKTYLNDNFWIETSSNFDNGGVHINSGVQNYWFYLITEGGSGTNANGNTYDIQGIGLDKAERIAYRNLSTYLTNASGFFDAKYGSIQAAIDLFGAESEEAQVVEDAWCAVGVGNCIDPDPIFCDGLTEFTALQGSFSDGSTPNYPYANNSLCSWRINPDNADYIELTFNSFETERDFDFVRVYDGLTNNASLIGEYSGAQLPSKITSSGDALFVQFSSDVLLAFGGFDADYQAFTGNSIQELNGFRIQVLPNPNSGNLTLAIGNNGLTKSIVLVSAEGSVIQQAKTTQDNYAISGLAPGIYFAQISAGSESVTVKVIVQ